METPRQTRLERQTRLDLLFSADDNFAMQLGVSILSALECNFEHYREIHIRVIGHQLTAESIGRIEEICARDFADCTVSLVIIDSRDLAAAVHTSGKSPLGDSVFFRLLVTTVADEAAERLIYLDADCLVVDDLVELTTMNLDAYSLGAVVDLQCTEEHKQGLRLGYEDDYFNNGVMVYNLAQARARELEQRLVAYVNAPDIANNYIDQDAISVVLRGEIRALPLRYNVVPALFYLNDSNRRAMIESRSFGQKRFYEADVIRTARTKPAIIHFVGSKLYGRPWLDFCHHPWRDTWRALKANTPWRDTPLLPSHLTPIQRLFAFCVRLAMRTFPAAWLDAFLRRHPR